MSINRVKNTLEKHQPEMLVGFGVVSVIIGTIKMCKKTKEADEVMEEANHELTAIHNDSYGYHRNKSLSKAYCKMVTGLAKAYGPGAAIEGIGIVALLLSNGIYKDRALTFSAGYAAVSEMYNQYRRRVADKYGEDADLEILYNVQDEKVKKEYIDENGKKKSRTKTVKKANGPILSPCFRVFGPNSREYRTGDPDANIWYLNDVESYFNNLLRIEKTIYLDRVLRELDLLYCEDDEQAVKRLHIMGWTWDPNGPDNQISFGIKARDAAYNGGFVNAGAFNGEEEEFMLEFNCSPDVWSD